MNADWGRNRDHQTPNRDRHHEITRHAVRPASNEAQTSTTNPSSARWLLSNTFYFFRKRIKQQVIFSNQCLQQTNDKQGQVTWEVTACLITMASLARRKVFKQVSFYKTMDFHKNIYI
jgi:hypothetical protein